MESKPTLCPSKCESERSYLRVEIETNKKLVFERALVIAGVGFIATLFPNDAEGSELLGVPVIGALAFNLWFTVNRLKSNSRIIAYVQLFHESAANHCWIGWENALRQYRIWHKNRDCDQERETVKEKIKHIEQYDNLSFYNGILILHLSMAAAIAGLMCYRAWILESMTPPPAGVPVLVLSGIYLTTVFVFFFWARLEYQPEELKDAIEKERIRWAAVYESYTSGKLRSIKDTDQQTKS